MAAYAQGDARFSGTVLDQTGAFVPGATVTVKNQKTGEERTVTSTAAGPLRRAQPEAVGLHDQRDRSAASRRSNTPT